MRHRRNRFLESISREPACPIQTLSQAAMVFSLMNRDIHSTVPGVKNAAEAEETAGCVDLPRIPDDHLHRLQALYERDFM
jgi:aryl-alcohol dehydrogenase-like predicted oxidoreductase